MNNYQEYIDEKIFQLRILVLSQWDYLKYSDLNEWLDDNFKNDTEGRYYAIKILLNTIYYSKKDIERLLYFGLYEKIYGNLIKSKLIENENIYISNSEADALVHKLKLSSFFIPLLDSDKPSESGNSIIGDLVHKLNITESQVSFHWNVSELVLKNYKLLIFVDDCVGSGNQLKRFWKSEKIRHIKEVCCKYGIQVFYLVLIGYEKNLKSLAEQNHTEGINVVVCDILTDRNRIFSDQNNIWNREFNEKDKAIQYFDKIKRQKGINFLGYKDLDFAVILHDRLPNWTLPIFWKELSGWKCLLRRKTSI